MSDVDKSALDPTQLRRALACFPSGVTAVGALIEDRPQAMVASSFTSVSLDPALVSVCVAHTSTTWPTLRGLPRLGVSVLAAGHADVAAALAAKSGDRFQNVDWRASPLGAVFVEGSTLWLECAVHAEVPAGDHDIVLLRIMSVQAYVDVPPMVFHGSRYRQLQVSS